MVCHLSFKQQPDISCQLLCILPGKFYGCLVGYSVLVHIYVGSTKLISGEMHVGLLTDISWRQDSELQVQVTWILNICYVFFRFLPKTLDFATFYFQPGDNYCSTISLAAETQSYESACSYSQLKISLYSLLLTDAGAVVYGLCLWGKEIFEKLGSKENISHFSPKAVPKIKISQSIHSRGRQQFCLVCLFSIVLVAAKLTIK